MARLVVLVLALVHLAFGLVTLQRRAPPAFFDPRPNGGSMLDRLVNGFGEPLNVIISALSSPSVLTDDGILNYARSIGFSTECLGIHLGDAQAANLGDGNGWVNQTVELRQDFNDPLLGTCLESLIGGNHFRVFRQNGALANSGALFLAVSFEENVTKGHTTSANGYDLGRDAFVNLALQGSSFGGVTYKTTAQNFTDLLAPGSDGIDDGIATDGRIVLLTVTII
ncbi:hypothetical protein FA95DRAFT_1554092 [Auriscalpium vulgare]|uniref:Uncharacterized protein n=1 Tax=Auriscalpium vulgare TaxID=40419 RepID=A0ACB8S7S0_9AGAM|nr:hypothetical protein FA95DRAFT_1554092 [Auriscalpium vulgare]